MRRKLGLGIKSKEQDKPQETEHHFDRRSHLFANSAYRSTKQRGFLTGDDVLKSIESDEEFIKRLNIPSYASLSKLGKL